MDEGKLISVSARLARRNQAKVRRGVVRASRFVGSSSPHLLSNYIILDAVKLPPHFGFVAVIKTADKRAVLWVDWEADHDCFSIIPSASNLFSPVPCQGTNSTRYDVELVFLSCCKATFTAPFQQAEWVTNSRCPHRVAIPFVPWIVPYNALIVLCVLSYWFFLFQPIGQTETHLKDVFGVWSP